MNKIVREHYPVANLPEDLRAEFEGLDTVRIVIEEERPFANAEAVEAFERQYQENLLELGRQATADFGAHRGNLTVENAVARIRALRDEWDD